MVKKNKESPKTLECYVTSSKGTIIYGLTVMEKVIFSAQLNN